MPLSDRDYMKSAQPSRGGKRFTRSFNLGINPLFAIIIANVIIFIATLVLPDERFPFGDFMLFEGDKFTYYLGLIPYYFLERPWTILTNMFIHADFWHIFANMLTLFFFGRALSILVGQNKLLLIFFGGGIIGNVLYLLLGESLSIAVGASGGVFAVAGALAVMVPRMRVAVWGIIPMPLWLVILLFFVLWSIPNIVPGIAWQAHLGGLAAGLAAGYFFKRRGGYYVF